MKISKNGLEIIKEFEGFKDEAYLCQAQVWTIGYGSTYYPDGSKVKEGDEITMENATRLLQYQVDKTYGKAVNRYTQVNKLEQTQFDALVSFAYNVGIGALRTSTLLKLHNEGHTTPASQQFGRWKYVDGEVSNGLVRRREAEKALYLS